MEILYNTLYRLFSNELLNLNIGYEFNARTLSAMNELVNAIDYIENGNPSSDEIIKIMQYYEEV
nr:MAG TPA: hypothetical protein [Bacteriophage sp.]DAX47884.1 MAG TPA: hypothetical protein [Bacteriophage sp.]